jgi:adenylate cyclase
MISIINNVRARVQRECGVDVNMRIGVHSGKIISGILGTNKWQYDIWSRDVIIANKMEQTGEAGKVHVTQQTLNLLDTGSYNYKPAKKLNDDILNKYGIIQSYLITPAVFPASTSLVHFILRFL